LVIVIFVSEPKSPPAEVAEAEVKVEMAEDADSVGSDSHSVLKTCVPLGEKVCALTAGIAKRSTMPRSTVCH
jgi:hypothetical protein